MDTPPHGLEASSPKPVWTGPSRRDLSGMTLGDFQVERLLGHGGMGEVYLARQVSLDRPVALKVLKPELLSNPTYLARFEKEALSAAKLNHPNIVHVYSFGGFDNLKYIAMEFVAGTNLKDYVARKGPLPANVAWMFLRQAAAALAAAAEVGLVHRDIKPENLLLTRKGQVKVADFGLCRTQSSAEGINLTQEGVTLGTPMYMSPEQVQGRELDPRSDLYSLGVTAYHMLAGAPPFTAESAVALALKHVREQPVSLAVHRPDLSPEFVAVVMRMLAKAPEDRPQSAAELLRDLNRVRETVQGLALPNGPSAVLGPSLSTASGQVTSPVARPQAGGLRDQLSGLAIGRRPLALVGLGAVLLGLLLGAIGRAPDLLGPGAPRPGTAPGLWMEDWAAVPAFPTAAAQYRHALLDAPRTGRVAAWLAVPGRYPEARDWAAKAYVQLVRTLFRRGDVDRLRVLALELERSPDASQAALARVARAGVAALLDQPNDVLAGELLSLASDPTLAELSLEVVVQARRSAGATGTVGSGLLTLQDNLAEALDLLPLVRLGLVRLD